MDLQHRLVAGRYRLLSPLGAGGMGTVWRGRDELLGREVAVKEVLFPRGLSEQDREVLRERTRREARAAARLDHPSAVTVYDVVEEDGAPYLVMELVEARTLSQVVREEGPLSPARTARVGLALLGALEAAHSRGIVHRDVKPANVLLGHGTGAAERVVLTDFGIASTAGDASITSTGLLLGSPSYIAPERARGRPPAPASDLWSLGATLFTAVEGRPPFDGGEPLLTVTAVVTGEHAPFERSGPLEQVLEGLLEREPAQRLSPAAARRALQAVADAPDAVVAPAADGRSRGGAGVEPVTQAVRRIPAVERTTALPVDELAVAAGASAAGAPVAGAGGRAGTATRPRPAASAGAPVVRTADWPRPSWDEPVRRPRGGGRTPVVVLALVLLLAAGTTAVALTLGLDLDGDRSPAARPGASTAPSAAPSPTPADAVEPAPAGWRTVRGAAGWTAAVPPTYATSTFNGEPQYKDDDTGRTLRVSATAPGGGPPDPVQDRRAASTTFAATHEDYVELGITAVDYRDHEAADWEFTYTDGGSSLHALSRVLVVDGRGYSLFFQTRGTDDWAEARADFEQIAASFEPA